MRIRLLTCSIALIFFSCNKPDNPPDNTVTGVDYTQIPQAENVNTEIIAYTTNELMPVLTGFEQFNILNDFGGVRYSFPVSGSGMVYTYSFPADKNMTKVKVFFSNATSSIRTVAPTSKSFAVSSSIKNYVRVIGRLATNSGSIKNSVGGTLPFANGGSITFGINSFYQLPTQNSLGLYDPAMLASVYTSYFNPEDKEFAVRIPGYLAADDGDKRWFLKSYGILSFAMSTNDLYNENIDFFQAGTADIKMPVTASLQGGAPDSVGMWQLLNGYWNFKGWAKKQGNFYVGKVRNAGTWNFATTQKGVYLTVNLRSDSNATVTGTVVRIKNNNLSIAESMTDADGNAVCFVPSNTPLTAEIIPDYRAKINNSNITFPLAPLTKAGSITLTLPFNTPDLSLLFGNVLNCNNDPVSSGVVKITMSDNRDYYIPFKDGKFTTGIWISGNNSNLNNAKIEVTDNAGNKGDPVLLSLDRNRYQLPNFYTCTNSPGLYCNFSIDNKTFYQLKDKATQPSPFLITVPSTTYIIYSDIKTTNSNNIGVNFGTLFKSVGRFPLSPIPDIFINGLPCTFDLGPGNSYESLYICDRFDPVINGYVEGYFTFSYKDNNNITHQVRANFKVKKLF